MGAPVFGTEQLSVPVKLTAEEEIVQKQRQCKSLIGINGGELSDPFTELEGNWIGEEEGMEKWPPIFQIQIAEFILTKDAILANVFLVFIEREKRLAILIHSG